MNLRGFFAVARLAEHVNVDLWNATTPDGRSIRRALDFLAQYVEGDMKWSHKQLGGVELETLYPLLREAMIIFCEPRYGSLINQLDQEKLRAGRLNLLLPTPDHVTTQKQAS